MEHEIRQPILSLFAERSGRHLSSCSRKLDSQQPHPANRLHLNGPAVNDGRDEQWLRAPTRRQELTGGNSHQDDGTHLSA